MVLVKVDYLVFGGSMALKTISQPKKLGAARGGARRPWFSGFLRGFWGVWGLVGDG